MKKRSKLTALFFAAVLSLSVFCVAADAVGEDEGYGDESSIAEPDPVTPEPDYSSDTSSYSSDYYSSDTQSYNSESYYSSDTSSYSGDYYSSDTQSYYSSYGYDDYNTNSYDSYSNDDTYSESSYVGGGQSYVAPDNTAPSADLIESDGDVDESTLSSSDWSDISASLKNASTSSDDDDFNFIKNNTSKGDNGQWMFVLSLVLIGLSLAGITYFVLATLHNRRRAASGKVHAPAQTSSSRTRSLDDYGDRYAKESKKKVDRRRRFDTAEIRLPKERTSDGRGGSNSRNRYR